MQLFFTLFVYIFFVFSDSFGMYQHSILNSQNQKIYSNTFLLKLRKFMFVRVTECFGNIMKYLIFLTGTYKLNKMSCKYILSTNAFLYVKRGKMIAFFLYLKYVRACRASKFGMVSRLCILDCLHKT